MMTITVLLLALKSLLVAAATLLLLRLTRTRSSAERSTIAHLGLFALMALPLASLALPQIVLPMPAAIARFASPPDHAGGPASLPADEATSGTSYVGPVMAPTPTAPSQIASTLLRYAYFVPTLALLALTLAALLRLFGLRARAEILVDPDWLSALALAQRRMGFKSGTALLKSEELGSPVSWGLMRPTILLNEAAVLAPEQAEAIIAHELAHVVHFDWAKLILARVATATFWFNPLAWVLAREAHQLREEAADDAVLAANISGTDYAELLIGVARHQCRGALLGAHGVAPSKSSLGRRVRRVLDQSSARRPSGRSWVAGFTTGMLTMAVPLAAVGVAPTRAAPSAVPITRSFVQPVDHYGSEASEKTNIVRKDDGRSLVAKGARENTAPTVAVDLIRARRPKPASGASTKINKSLGMPVDEASGAYQRAMATAGLPHLSADDLIAARAVGLTPEYVRAMRAAGMRGDIDDLIGARAAGVTPDSLGSLLARPPKINTPSKLTSSRTAVGNRDP